jgi:hypothetical protein
VWVVIIGAAILVVWVKVSVYLHLFKKRKNSSEKQKNITCCFLL